ncbi:hypothetical protein Tco_0851506, partial [Tanacetum coccineum]
MGTDPTVRLRRESKYTFLSENIRVREILGFPNISPPCRVRVRANRLLADSDTLPQASYESVGPRPNYEGTTPAQKPEWGPCLARVRANRLLADSDTLSQASYKSVGPRPNCEGTAQA